MNHDYNVHKCPYLGWTAETYISLGEIEKGKQRVLSFTTVKRATEKAITQAHLISALEFDKHIEAAKAQYVD